MTTNSFHTHAAVLSTGDELVMGQLLDTNTRWIAERLTERGIRVVEAAVVGDNQVELQQAIERLCRRAPLVVMSGGLGATDGDLTRQAVCGLTGDSMITDEAEAVRLAAWLAQRGRAVTDRQLRQAQRPSRASPLRNGVGTAPGLHASVGAADLICLPGPPGELRPMWRESVEPRLRPDPARTVLTRLLYVIGLPEADAADRLRDLTARGGEMTVNLTASGGVLTVRARAEGTAPGLSERFEGVVQSVVSRLDGHCFAQAPASDTPSGERLCATLLGMLKQSHETLATVESCTGGMLGQMITAIPGSSASYLGGLVTYSNGLKSGLVSVDEDLIRAHGAVSSQVAAAMAVGGLRATCSTHALSITGVAGPEGGSEEKPVGTVWIARARATTQGYETDVRGFRFTGDRVDVRTRACTSALTMLWFALQKRDPGRLLWEHVR